MRVYLSTGDTSAEPHALGFIRACQRQNPDCQFSVMGGDILRAGGVDIVFDSTEIKVMGFAAIIRHLPKIFGVFYEVLEYIASFKPEVVVLVDYPGFHLRLAKAIKKRFPDIKIVYYITPQVWAWHRSRVKIIREYIDWAMCILPFEEAWFREQGVSAEYVGSPVYDGVKGTDPTIIRKQLGIAATSRIVAIFAGSRRKELEYILQPMLAAARIVREKTTDDIVFVLSVALGMEENIRSIVGELPGYVKPVTGQAHEIMAGSDFVFAKSGTTTLEAALLGKPMLVAYRGDWLSAKLAKFLKKLNDIPYISLPNIIAGKEIVPEFLQEECNGQTMAEYALQILQCAEESARIKAELAQVRDAVGEEESAVRAADSFLRFIREKLG